MRPAGAFKQNESECGARVLFGFTNSKPITRNRKPVFTMVERTLIILKPDCVERGLMGQVLFRFEQRGLKVAAARLLRFSPKLCDEHYAHLKDKPFFPALVSFMTSKPVLCAVLEGTDAVQTVRDMCGPTDSKKASKGTIRGDFGTDVQSNIIHASDSKETATVEIARFFKTEELFSY